MLHRADRSSNKLQGTPHSQRLQHVDPAWAHIPAADALRPASQASEAAPSLPGSATSHESGSPARRETDAAQDGSQAAADARLVAISYAFDVSFHELHLCFGRAARRKRSSRAAAAQAAVPNQTAFSFELQVVDAQWSAASSNTAAQAAWTMCAVASRCILVDTTCIFADSKRLKDQLLPRECTVLTLSSPKVSENIHSILRRPAVEAVDSRRRPKASHAEGCKVLLEWLANVQEAKAQVPF